jgi:hypothetical protein
MIIERKKLHLRQIIGKNCLSLIISHEICWSLCKIYVVIFGSNISSLIFEHNFKCSYEKSRNCHDTHPERSQRYACKHFNQRLRDGRSSSQAQFFVLPNHKFALIVSVSHAINSTLDHSLRCRRHQTVMKWKCVLLLSSFPSDRSNSTEIIRNLSVIRIAPIADEKKCSATWLNPGNWELKPLNEFTDFDPPLPTRRWNHRAQVRDVTEKVYEMTGLHHFQNKSFTQLSPDVPDGQLPASFGICSNTPWSLLLHASMEFISVATTNSSYNNTISRITGSCAQIKHVQ